MMNLTGCQRLRTAKLRRPLPIPFRTSASQSYGVFAIGRPAATIRPCPTTLASP